MSRLVFPILRLVVWVVIAAALVYLAFFKSAADPEASGPEQPSMQLTSPTVPVMKGTVTNSVTLDAQVVADPTTPVKATAAGKVSTVPAKVGAAVAAGDVLYTIKSPIEPTTQSDPSAPPPPTQYKTTQVKAPIAGIIATLDVLIDQEVTVGLTTASINPGTLSVQTTLTPDSQYRLTALPPTAAVEVPGGPAPFECANVHIVVATPGTGSDGSGDPGTGQPPSGSGATVQCAVPPGTPIYAGSSGTATFNAGVATDVLVVPVTAVQGKVGTGNVWKVDPAGGEPVLTPVTLGLTDGALVEIKEGLLEGDEILEFIPVESVNGPQPGQDPGMPGNVVIGPGG